MNLSIGIIGLPNVGKSTLFNTLTNISVPAENYPFCTIDPNYGIVEVKDERIDILSKISNSFKTVYPVIEFVDIAGLVKGAHKGEGLGNKFLSNIKTCNAIIHIIRVFSSNKIIHVENRVDPKTDMEIIQTELILKDIESIENKIDKLKKENKFDKLINLKLEYLLHLKSYLEKGKTGLNFINDFPVDPLLNDYYKELFLITFKPVIYLLNLDDVNFDSQFLINKYRQILNLASEEIIIPINIQQEFELSLLSLDERIKLINDLNLEFSVLDQLISKSFDILGLMNFFTTGETESRGWTIPKNSNIVDAAGAIHTDFSSKFIAADVVSFNDFVDSKGWTEARLKGKVKLEGKNYVVKDGDIIIFKHGA